MADGGEGHRTADAIVASIERKIGEGVLRDSAPLPSERVLMAEYGASRTVVREAITALSNRGLIECKPRHRPVVRPLGFQCAIDATGPVIRQLLNAPGGVRTVHDCRVFIERGLVRDAALGAGREHIRALKDALAANEAAIVDCEAFYVTDVAFHRVLYLVPDNPVLPAIHEGFTAWLAPQWSRVRCRPERNALDHAAHRAIYEAILERDPDAAEGALTAHLEATWTYVSGLFSLAGPQGTA